MSTETGTDDLLVERSGAVATVVLNRPRSRNAINLAMYAALPDLVRGLDADPAVKVVLFTGAGGQAFASGADISEFETVRKNAETASAYNVRVAAAERAIAGLSKPTVAVVHGYCIGGGVGLALACDLRFGDENTRMAVTPANLGLVYSLESTKRIAELVGPSRTKWILMSGRHMDAETCLRLGLIDELVPADQLDAHAAEFAEHVATRAQYSVRGGKAMVNRISAGQLTEDDESTRLRDASFDTADYAEGVRAFLERRKPVFTWS